MDDLSEGVGMGMGVGNVIATVYARGCTVTLFVILYNTCTGCVEIRSNVERRVHQLIP